MVWKFGDMVDGPVFLKPYGFGAFDKSSAFNILSHFLMVSGSVFFLSILPEPNFLRRKPSLEHSGRAHGRHQSRASSSDSVGDYIDKFDSSLQLPSKVTMAIKPIIFARESSITAKSQLSISVSQTGETNNAHGPTVTLEEVSYRIKDILSPAGFKTVLHKVSGQFDWGKLSMILGSTGSGKSTLLHVMANDVGYSAMTGNILHNRELVDPKLLPWQRCAFVEAQDEHLRDLTVLDIITYAMKLRCLNRKGLAVVEENVNRTLDILKLVDVKDFKSKDLGAGDRRRLSIAEEIVHGPNLLIIDEPTTGLELRDVSTMLLTFREMVNQDKTVIASMHQPSKEAFKVFDTVMILAKGRCIYHGSVENAQPYFMNCPYGLSFQGYENPAEYLLDISAGLIKDAGGNPVTAMDLSAHFERSEFYVKPQEHDVAAALPSKDYTLSSDGGEPQLPGSTVHVPLLNPEDSEKDLHRGMEAGRHGSSFSMGISTLREVENHRRSFCGEITSIVREYIDGCVNLDLETYLWKMWLLLERSSRNLFHREKMVLGTCVLFILMATVLGFALGNTSRYYSTSVISLLGQEKTLYSSTYLYNTTAFFAISLLLMVFANVQFIYYWMKSNEVFLKEHSRGLYSNVQHWMTASPALYVLRGITIAMYAGISYNMLVLRDKEEIMTFYYVSVILSVEAGTMLCEAIAVMVPDIRTAYQLIPGVVFLNFAFSGIFVKTPTLPLGSRWLPVISLFRWTVEAQAINQFDGDSSLVCVEQFYFCTYESFITLFGWATNSKYYCLYVIIINLFVYRAMILMAQMFKTFAQRGRRQFREGIKESENLYTSAN
jgi:ABC-type multidrug transport system ATPase subunit